MTTIDDVLMSQVNEAKGDVDMWIVERRDHYTIGRRDVTMHGPFYSAQEAFDWAANHRGADIATKVFPLYKPGPIT
jgi:hypothetical protein